MTEESQPANATETKPESTEAKPDAPASPVTQASTPEKYEFKLPDGVKLDTEALSAEAKHLGLSQEAAQKLVELKIKSNQAIAEAQKNEHQSWIDAVKADKELGADLKKTEAMVKAGVEFLAKSEPAFIKLITETKLIDHPAFVRMLRKVGADNSNDKFVGGSSETKLGGTPAERIANRYLQSQTNKG